jgi:hypothetical protein
MRKLDRRKVLRGVLGGGVVSIALPRLDAMLNGGGNAYADGGALPKRFGTWFWGNGILIKRWVPAATGMGSAWALTDQLAPLANVKDDITVVSGMRVKTGGNVHGAGLVGMLTGAGCLGPGEPGQVAAAPSIDQVIAKAIGKATPFTSLEVGCEKEAATGSAIRGVSYPGSNQINLPELGCKAVFDRLFGGFTPPSPGAPTATGPDPRALVRKSVLDAIQQDMAELRATVGAADMRRLDQHLDGIRDIERRLQTMSSTPAVATGACTTPSAPASSLVAPSGHFQPAVHQMMADLVTMALACDRTRVFSIMFSQSAAWIAYPNINGLFHGMCHNEAGDQPTVHQFVVATMKELAYFLEKLKSVKEGAGTLLDSCAVLATSDVSDGRTHSQADYPIVVAGRCGGRLRAGMHVRAADDTSTKVLFSLARAMDVPLTEIGAGAGRVTSGLAAIEA